MEQENTGYEPGTVRRFHSTRPHYNFGPGPAPMPTQVLEQVQRELLDFQGTGLSVLSMSHRSPEFSHIRDDALEKIAQVLQLPETHRVVFVHGGGHGQFAAVPLNLIKDEDKANSWGEYLRSGTWTDRAYNEGSKFANVRFIDEIDVDTTAKYVYLCGNETVNGTEVRTFPKLRTAALVVDMSSDIASKPIDWSNVAVGFACTPKNLGHPGLTVLVIREDLLTPPQKACPGVLDWYTMYQSKSVWNTPATFNIYTTKLVCDWILESGGLEEMERRAIAKSALLYDLIDSSEGYYTTPLKKGDPKRSRMNIPFGLKGEPCDSPLTTRFLKAAYEENIVGLLTLTPFGYGSYLRASMYNHVTEEMAQYLCDFMTKFRKENA